MPANTKELIDSHVETSQRETAKDDAATVNPLAASSSEKDTKSDFLPENPAREEGIVKFAAIAYLADQIIKDVGSEKRRVDVEKDYFNFSNALTLLPFYVKDIQDFLDSDSGTILGLASNFLDGALNVLCGSAQWLSAKQNPDPTITRIKAAVNFANGAQLIIVTALIMKGILSFLCLPFTLAATFSASFLLSCIDFGMSVRRRVSFDYWLDNSLKQLDVIDKKLCELDSMLAGAKICQVTIAANPASANWLFTYLLPGAINRMQKQKDKLLAQKATIEDEVAIRVAHRIQPIKRVVQNDPIEKLPQNKALHEETRNKLLAKIDTYKPQFQQSSNVNLPSAQNTQPVSSPSPALSPLREKMRSYAATGRNVLQFEENRIQTKYTLKIFSAVRTTVSWAAAAAGMIASCFTAAEGVPPAVIYVLIAASALKLSKLLGKIPGAVKTVIKGVNNAAQCVKTHGPDLISKLFMPAPLNIKKTTKIRAQIGFGGLSAVA